ncbi:MAG: hypothetical protein ACOCRO_01770 [Halanaerobiales bacterium]
MKRIPKKGEIIYFPGTDHISPFIGIVEEIEEIEPDGERIYMKNIMPNVNDDKMKLGNFKEKIWIGKVSTPYKMSFIVGDEIPKRDLIKLFFENTGS